MKPLALFCILIGLTIGNFGSMYLIDPPDYSLATDRSEFQAVALFAAWLSSKF